MQNVESRQNIRVLFANDDFLLIEATSFRMYLLKFQNSLLRYSLHYLNLEKLYL